MSKTIHMCLSVRGALNQPKSRLKGWIRHDDGRLMTPDEARSALMDELAKGHEVIPIGDCDDFDFKTGCRGHEDAPEETAKAQPNRNDGNEEGPAPEGTGPATLSGEA